MIIFSIALGFLCFGTQHSSSRTAFSFVADLMLLAILAVFLPCFSSYDSTIFFSSLVFVPCFSSCAFLSFSFIGSLCKIVYLMLELNTVLQPCAQHQQWVNLKTQGF